MIFFSVPTTEELKAKYCRNILANLYRPNLNVNFTPLNVNFTSLNVRWVATEP